MLEPLPGLAALEHARVNEYRSWLPSANHDRTAAARFARRDYFTVEHKPKFTIKKNSPIFTMGSCFARNIEIKLKREDMQVLTGDFSIPLHLYKGSQGLATAEEPEGRAHRGVLNKYNVHSMLMELKRALEPFPIADDGLIEVGEGQWYDPQSSNLKPNSREIIADVRSSIQAVTARAKEADILFFTLGLTETWYDDETGLSLNTPPPPLYIKKFGSRFRFQNSSFRQIFESLTGMVELLARTGRAGHKIIITVSPVPFGNTFTEMDVVTANTYSKATLVSAAMAVAANYGHVDYFPSYEMVTHTPRELAYQEDYAHVNNAMVQHVVSHFSRLYLEASA